MVRLLVLLVFVILAGCGSNPPATATAPPVANVAPPPDASVVSSEADADADVGFVETFGCCSQGHWTCGRTPLPGEGCGSPHTSGGGCCQGGHWVCSRMPLPGECPGSGLP